MSRLIHLYVGGENIGIVNHDFVYNDEANSGREVCEGCLLVLHDYKYRVEKVIKVDDGFVAHLRKSNK